jgi:hypothetical protein
MFYIKQSRLKIEQCGIDITGSPLVHVPGWMGIWMGGWMDGSKSRSKYCLQQSKIVTLI